MEDAAQDMEALDALDNRGNEWVTLPRGLKRTNLGRKRAASVAGGCSGFRSVRNVLSMAHFMYCFALLSLDSLDLS